MRLQNAYINVGHVLSVSCTVTSYRRTPTEAYRRHAFVDRQSRPRIIGDESEAGRKADRDASDVGGSDR